MATIRNLTTNDKDKVREICTNTANNVSSPKDQQLNWLLYCDYYVDNNCDTSFVAVDDNDEAIGYVFCAPDYKAYELSYRANYLKTLTELSPWQSLQKTAMLLLERMLSKKASAHLHINIQPDWQRKGIGHQLMDALVTKLASLNIPNAYLIVDSKNQRSINFYEKYGFTKLRKVATGIQYILNIFNKNKQLTE